MNLLARKGDFGSGSGLLTLTIGGGECEDKASGECLDQWKVLVIASRRARLASCWCFIDQSSWQFQVTIMMSSKTLFHRIIVHTLQTNGWYMYCIRSYDRITYFILYKLNASDIYMCAWDLNCIVTREKKALTSLFGGLVTLEGVGPFIEIVRPAFNERAVGYSSNLAWLKTWSSFLRKGLNGWVYVIDGSYPLCALLVHSTSCLC